MKEFLLSKGWVINRDCHCGGVHKIEYVHIDVNKRGITIKTLPAKETWRAIRRGRKLRNGTQYDIENYINELDQVAV